MGAILGTTFNLSLLEFGRLYVRHAYAKAVEAQPSSLAEVREICSAAEESAIGEFRGLHLFRYRFLYGEDIEVLYDENWRVVEISPAFARSWGRPWPFHRMRRLGSV